ncbi:MAG: GDCCVxC domain-containing (seleno)protein [Balneolaceae bacterium]|nr:GDCCVxC domain-containing (seleno)protein [Balneolaceae bacterium]
MSGVIVKSILTCPNCNRSSEQPMPTDSCQYFWECEYCKSVIKPKPGDCCVFCSYGSVPCPPIQQNRRCC